MSAPVYECTKLLTVAIQLQLTKDLSSPPAAVIYIKWQDIFLLTLAYLHTWTRSQNVAFAFAIAFIAKACVRFHCVRVHFKNPCVRVHLIRPCVRVHVRVQILSLVNFFLKNFLHSYFW